MPIKQLSYCILVMLLFNSCTMQKSNSGPKVPIVYSDEYNIRFFGIQHLHPFDTEKYKKVTKSLKNSLGLQAGQYHEPKAITDQQLLKVHSKEYLSSLQNADVIAAVAEMPILSKLPVSVLKKKMLHPFRIATAGTLLAGELAMEHGWSINLSGGYHHAKENNGEGFCFLADVNLMIEHLREQGKIQRALIVDLDAHQGNGHESIHGADEQVFILDMYNASIYPGETELKPYINYDVPLKPRIKDKRYLSLLEERLPRAIAESKPDILIYVAGTDIYELDPLGQLSISKEGIKQRDAFVFKCAREAKLPIVMTLSGGYHKDSGPIIGESIGEILKADYGF